MITTLHPYRSVTTWLVAFAVVATPSAAPLAAAEPDRPSEEKKEETIEVRFSDNSVLNLRLLDERLTLVTPYGKLQVPVAEIQRIDFATRVSDDVAKRIAAAIGNLGSPQFAAREAASADLAKLREKAYPALLEAAKQKDPEVIRRAEFLLEKIRETVPEEKLEVRPYDVIQTAHSKIAGRIENSSLKAHTAQFGEVPLRLSDVRSLGTPLLLPDPALANAVPDPGTLIGYQNQVGKTFVFKVTGVVSPSLWGTDVYTSDSSLAAAAVHAGVLRPGQAGFLKVKIVPPPLSFTGSSRNGVTSNGYAAFHGAYQVIR